MMRLEKIKNDSLPYWILAIIYALLIFLISANPKPPTPEGMVGIKIPYYDKIAHFFLYSIFGLILYSASIRTERMRDKELSAFLIGAVYAFTDEIHQRFVPGRSCDPMDFLVDAVGIAAGIVFYIWKWRKL